MAYQRCKYCWGVVPEKVMVRGISPLCPHCSRPLDTPNGSGGEDDGTGSGRG